MCTEWLYHSFADKRNLFTLLFSECTGVSSADVTVVGSQHVREIKIHWHWLLHRCQVGGIRLKKGWSSPSFSQSYTSESASVGMGVASVRTIESVCDVCCDATLTFAGLSGKVCKQFTATVVRMHTNYKGSAATPLFADWPSANRDSARRKLNRDA